MCVFGSAPVRAEPSHTSEMSSQMLFGETCDVFEEKGVFGRVRLDFDGYEGWVDMRLLDQYEKSEVGDFTLTDELMGTVQSCESVTPNLLEAPRIVPLGSVLHHFNTPHFQFGGRKHSFDGRVRHQTQPGTVLELLDYAQRFINVPYVWGGRSPWGIDCSGLVQQVFRAFGISLLRDTGQQIKQGESVDSLGDALPGDLAFFGEPTNHVGIIFPNHKILHASGFGRMDLLTEDGIFHAQSGKLTHALSSIRRIWKPIRGHS